MEDGIPDLTSLDLSSSASSFAALHDPLHGVILRSLGLRERCSVAARVCQSWRAHARELQRHHPEGRVQPRGSLAQNEGELLMNLLDYGRCTVCELGFARLPGVDSPGAVSGLRAAGRMAELGHLNACVYTHWCEVQRARARASVCVRDTSGGALTARRSRRRQVYSNMRDSGVRGPGALAIPADYRRIGPQRVHGDMWVLAPDAAHVRCRRRRPTPPTARAGSIGTDASAARSSSSSTLPRLRPRRPRSSRRMARCSSRCARDGGGGVRDDEPRDARGAGERA